MHCARRWPSTLDPRGPRGWLRYRPDRKSTRLNSSHRCISYAVFCLKKKNLYDEWVRIEWVDRLRDIERSESVEHLQQPLQHDHLPALAALAETPPNSPHVSHA